jgi:hypothetical protein
MMATRSPSCICSPTNFLSVSRASSMLEGESPISSTTKAMVRRTSSGAICRVGIDSGATTRLPFFLAAGSLSPVGRLM